MILSLLSRLNLSRLGKSERAVLSDVRVIGGGLVMIFIIAWIMTEMHDYSGFETDEDGNYVGPMGDVVGTLDSMGELALVILVIAMVLVAAGAILKSLNSFGGR